MIGFDMGFLESDGVRFSKSGEVEGSIADRFLAIANRFAEEVEQGLNDPILEGLDFEICYIPIVMKADEHNWYSPRTKVSQKDRILYACPKLDYSAFALGGEAEAVREYTSGLRSELSKLAKLSVTAEQISEISRLFQIAEANLVSKYS